MTETFCPYCLSLNVIVNDDEHAFLCGNCKLKWSYDIEDMRRDIHETLEEMSHEVPR